MLQSRDSEPRCSAKTTQLYDNEQPYMSRAVCSTCPENSDDNQMHHGKPVRGTKQCGPTTIVWYCCECRDGPYSIWQNVCDSCSHIICGYCDKEEV
ncbi:hypothetical protein HBI56_132420 [Parastagonospora nodorum]|nr:hypothetical protein HBI09_035970 [Parastagonospora nodorum]KAH4209196.1 hypothetical protein HBI95_086820 [Parastagonospora nodorum]KAH4999577.1 hypothetical protein HBI77_174320 [Parastagonospora nodorum]KAH5021100.1 hypothetical protein HBI74_151100 [Parastagonospora nodorum]KAH5072714.1 hypothetical protein HBH95_161440 [Parastagonospora nodorum]